MAVLSVIHTFRLEMTAREFYLVCRSLGQQLNDQEIAEALELRSKMIEVRAKSARAAADASERTVREFSCEESYGGVDKADSGVQNQTGRKP